MTGKEKRIRCRTLFFTFLKIGAFTFGGGYAMIPLIQKETVESHGWITDEDILDIIAVAEATPGAPSPLTPPLSSGTKPPDFGAVFLPPSALSSPLFSSSASLRFFWSPLSD